jgi:hypothetical protein
MKTPVMPVSWSTVRAVLLGWAVLVALTYLVERPLLLWTAPLLGASWLPTAELSLACAGLAATGWIIARCSGPRPSIAVVVFAVMLAAWNFGLEPAINIAWLFRLLADSFENPRYLESLFTSLAIHLLLFGSLLAGGFFGQAHEQTEARIFPLA